MTGPADDPYEPRGPSEDGEGRRTYGVSDFVKKAFETVGGEGTRLPKDALHYLLQQGDKGKKEVVRIVANEVREFLHHADLASEITKVLTSVQVDLKASFSFSEKDGKVRPHVSNSSSVSVYREEDDEDEGQPVSEEFQQDDL